MTDRQVRGDRARVDETVDVVVEFGSSPDPELNPLAGCMVSYDFSFPQNPFLTHHISLNPPEANEPFVIILDETVIWDLGDEVFFSGFETGDTTDWDDVMPTLAFGEN